MNSECVECGEKFNPKRLVLGYRTCLACGDAEATRQILFKAKCTAPAFNKGGYMYISSKRMAKDAGK